tara:strand:- start:1268 stop:6547 length:5280 start_codon:yes stop_codon:yes gene_type:complete
MPLNKLDNFIKNTDGRTLYVNPNDLESTDSIENQGNSLAKPFKTIQRALIESARFSYLKGNNNDKIEQTTILLFPGEHFVDNRPGFAIFNDASLGVRVTSPSGTSSPPSEEIALNLDSNFDLNQVENQLYKFNSVYGGIVVPRGTSLVGLDLRKTKIRPKYIPNPTDTDVAGSSIFRITGTSYFWQFSIFDGNELETVYTDPVDFSTTNRSKPTFSHHKLTCFEYADGVNNVSGYDISDLDMYYSKLSNAFSSIRNIPEKYPDDPDAFAKQRPEWEIVGAFAADPLTIARIESGSGGTAGPVITVTTVLDHGFNEGTPIKIDGVGVPDNVNDYNISTTVQSIINSKTFTYLLPYVQPNLLTVPDVSGAVVTIETDTVSGASPYIFNISLRSVFGMNGMHADGAKSSGFRSMVVAQFTGISLQKDDRAFVKYNEATRSYEGRSISKKTGAELSSGSSSLDNAKVYHLDSEAVYRSGWDTTHIKITNDAVMQIVSVFAIGYNKHFETASGGDASITNSNSNFGQFSLASDGFRKAAFDKDNKSYITSIITPRSIDESETNVDWQSLDVGLTTSVGISSQLYLYGFNNFDDAPPVLTQGYRIGAKRDDVISVDLGVGIGTFTSNICMVDNNVSGGTTSLGVNIAYKEFPVTSGPSDNIFTIGTHNLLTGESVVITSSNGDLPENIVPHRLYYVIKESSTTIKLASSKASADSDSPVTVYGGNDLTITSRVSDKSSGDVGHPVQWDADASNWYLHSTHGNSIYSALNTNGVSALTQKTDNTFIVRTDDSRSLDEKLYKVRIVVPKDAENAKQPAETFIIQESSSTGFRNDADSSRVSIGATDHDFARNSRFISTCISGSAGVVTVTSEVPHELNTGNLVNIVNVRSTTNTGGLGNLGYNGRFAVTGIVNDHEFTYSSTDVDSTVHTPGVFNSDTSVRNLNLPRFQKNDTNKNYYVYRSEIISDYIKDVQDGVYHGYVLNANNALPVEFNNFKYSQNVTNLYPELDKDNVNDNPGPIKSFAKRAPIGEVVSNDLTKSVTRETLDSFVEDFGIGKKITGVTTVFTSVNAGVATVTLDREHGFSGVTTYSSFAGGSGYNEGTHYNVKLLNDGTTTWDGATAKVVVGTGGTITDVSFISRGSGYTDAEQLDFDTSVLGSGTGAGVTISSSGISTNIGDAIQITGIGTTGEGYYKIASIPSKNQVSIAITAGDTEIHSGQYLVNLGPSVHVTSVAGPVLGITTFTSSFAHGLTAGSKVEFKDSSNNKLGVFVINEKVGVTTFTVKTSDTLSSTSYLVPHGFDSNNAASDAVTENLATRGVSSYDNDKLFLHVPISDGNTIAVTDSSLCGIATLNQFPVGSYVQIDNEIMRISNSSFSGTNSNELNVIRGVFGTPKESHATGSIGRKIKPKAIELRRPSIIRASGHTFEYLGFGPGNYSTGLPQVQVRTLTDKESFLAQSQKKAAGVVVYTGMNSEGDFFIGNKKSSSATGQERTFDVPSPTVTGQEVGRLSVVFDEVLIKERLRVEGGKSGTVLSQFDGPVTFNKEVRLRNTGTITGVLKLDDVTQSTSRTTGALVIAGGMGISGKATFGDEIIVDTGIIPDVDKGAYIGKSDQAFEEAYIDGIRLGVGGTTTIDTRGGDLVVSAAIGSSVSISTVTTMTSDLNVEGDITAFYTSDRRLKDNIAPIDDPLAKVISISGNTYDWNDKSGKTGKDVGVIAQELEGVLPEAVTTRKSGYLAVDYDKVVPLLVEAIKELNAKVDSLEQRLNN